MGLSRLGSSAVIEQTLVTPLSPLSPHLLVQGWQNHPMPARKHAEPWVLAMRDTLKAEVGPAYRVGDHKGKARLDIRFDDGSRQVGTLGIPWLAANAKTIRERVVKIAGLIGGGHTLKSALEQIHGVVQCSPRLSLQTPHPTN